MVSAASPHAVSKSILFRGRHVEAAKTAASVVAHTSSAAMATAEPFSSRFGASLSWFPGHMMKAAVAITERARDADVIVEVRDARAPLTTSAAAPGASSVGKPRLIILNKADLCPPELAVRASATIAAEAGPGARLTVLCASLRGGGGGSERSYARAIIAAADALPSRAASFRVAGRTLLVLGMSNVGKSSLINALRSSGGSSGSSRRDHLSAGAATGAAPGITRSVRTLLVRAQPPVYVFDTPGVVPPRVASVDAGMRLLLCGVLPEAAAPAVVQAEFLLHFFYQQQLAYGLRDRGGILPRYASALRLRRAYPPDDVEQCLGDLAVILGARVRGGGPCLDSAARHFVREFQRGALGQYCLDTLP